MSADTSLLRLLFEISFVSVKTCKSNYSGYVRKGI